MSLDAARAVADAVLHEGIKNRSRRQFGVLGPPHAAPSAFGEPPVMAMQCLLTPGGHVTVHLRFRHLQVRDVERSDSLQTLLSWDEAVEYEVTIPPFVTDFPVHVPAFSGTTPLSPATSLPDSGSGRFIRRRWPLTARVRLAFAPLSEVPLTRLTVTVTNEHPAPVADRPAALRHSLLGAHLLLEARDCSFVSVQDPPPFATAAAAECVQNRCWPVLAGGSSQILLGAPIILYDHPEVAARSPGELFDLTEIDEILTPRVLTMTDTEMAEARATDPRAAALIDRGGSLTPRDPRRDPAVGGPADPLTGTVEIGTVEISTVEIGGVPIGRDSLVVLRPTRRADARDLFLDGRLAKVTAVVTDVDGRTHVAVALADDPDADLHEWHGRHYYFAPDEIEPVLGEENHP